MPACPITETMSEACKMTNIVDKFSSVIIDNVFPSRKIEPISNGKKAKKLHHPFRADVSISFKYLAIIFAEA